MKIKEIGIWIGVIAILFAGCWLLISIVNSSPSPSEPIQITNLPPISKNDFTKGPENVKVTLIEYGDFQCPACGAYHPIVKQLEEEFSKDLKIVYRFFPLANVHKNAMLAAQTAYAAGFQNKFWKMHDMLYENQSAWSDTNPKDIFIEYAKELKLDVNKFKTDMDSDSAKKFINSQADTGLSIGINSTPTFFVNGNHIQSPSDYDGFKKIIQDEINKK